MKIALFLIFISWIACSFAWASNGQVEGILSSLEEDSILVTKTGSNEVIDLQITNQTQLDGLVSLEDLKTGSYVRINYKERDGRKVATSISKERPLRKVRVVLA